MRLWLGTALAVFVITSASRADELRDALDAAFSAGDMQRLTSIVVSQQEAAGKREVADWVKGKIATGERPAQMAMLAVSAAMRAGQPDDALMYVAYYEAQVLVDGITCSHKTEIGNQVLAAMFAFHKMAEGRKISPDRQRDAAQRALNLESATADKRTIDRSLCDGASYARDLLRKLPPPAGQPQAQAATARYAENASWRENRAKELPRVREILLMTAGSGK